MSEMLWENKDIFNDTDKDIINYIDYIKQFSIN